MTKYVYEFTEGDKSQKDLLGGKGANLAEMTNLGLPVPPGFTITTEACREYLTRGSAPGELRVQVTMALRQLEDGLGRRLGDRHDPLLVSVRSGAAFSMPGMMETVLNIGLNDASVKDRRLLPRKPVHVGRLFRDRPGQAGFHAMRRKCARRPRANARLWPDTFGRRDDLRKRALGYDVHRYQ
jgi:phosphoenolpyruvate synthase/pyruvate phosphate dikinase